MHKYVMIVGTMLFSASVNSASVSESWLQLAGVSCGGGLEVEVQGEIDAAILKRLKVGSVDGEGTFRRTEVETLLTQFRNEEKRELYKDYVTCLLTLMEMATNSSQLPARDVVLKSSVALSPLEIIKRGQRFVLAPKDTVAIDNHSLLFTLNTVKEDNKGELIYYTWSNSESNEGQANRYTRQAQIIQMGEQCSVVPYKIDSQNQQTSFLSNC